MANKQPAPTGDTKPQASQQPIIVAASIAQPQAAKSDQPNVKADMGPRSISLSQGDGESKGS